MRKIRAFTLLLLCCLLLGVACGPEAVEELPVLRSIGVSATDLALPSDGTLELAFTVEEPSFVFNYTIGSSLCQVQLLKQGGQVPTEFRISEVRPAGETGHYVAIIRDEGSPTRYEQSVCLAIRERPGSDAFVRSAYFTVRSQPKELSTGLSIVYVDTEDAAPVESLTEYVTAHLSIRGVGADESLQSIPCSIRGRGNTTWYWPKKPYLLKLDEKTSVLGMPKHKRWILLANFMDRTLMRNLVAMKVSSMTSLDWTPRCTPVELVLNGEHRGSYLLIEQVRVDKNRVPITEMKPEDNAGEALTGGYLLELDFHYDNEVQWIDPHGSCSQPGFAGIPFGIKSPDPDEITPAQQRYIQDYVAQAAGALYGPSFTDPQEGYAKYLDVDSFIDYWLVFEVLCNHELGNPGSVYLHKDRGGKLVAGPCWDFDWGVLSFYTSHGDRELVNRKAIWYERLFQDPAFQARVRARFEELLPQLETIPAYMDDCERLLTESARLNFQLWNPADDRSLNGGNIINGDELLSFHDAVARLKDNYRKHLQVMKDTL